MWDTLLCKAQPVTAKFSKDSKGKERIPQGASPESQPRLQEHTALEIYGPDGMPHGTLILDCGSCWGRRQEFSPVV